MPRTMGSMVIPDSHCPADRPVVPNAPCRRASPETCRCSLPPRPNPRPSTLTPPADLSTSGARTEVRLRARWSASVTCRECGRGRKHCGASLRGSLVSGWIGVAWRSGTTISLQLQWSRSPPLLGTLEVPMLLSHGRRLERNMVAPARLAIPPKAARQTANHETRLRPSSPKHPSEAANEDPSSARAPPPGSCASTSRQPPPPAHSPHLSPARPSPVACSACGVRGLDMELHAPSPRNMPSGVSANHA